MGMEANFFSFMRLSFRSYDQILIMQRFESKGIVQRFNRQWSFGQILEGGYVSASAGAGVKVYVVD